MMAERLIELSIMVAALEKDYEELDRLIGEMLPNERLALRDAILDIIIPINKYSR